MQGVELVVLLLAVSAALRLVAPAARRAAPGAPRPRRTGAGVRARAPPGGVRPRDPLPPLRPPAALLGRAHHLAPRLPGAALAHRPLSARWSCCSPSWPSPWWPTPSPRSSPGPRRSRWPPSSRRPTRWRRSRSCARSAPGESLTTILEGEGLVNDATALVAYRVAVGAAVTGSFSPGRAAVGLLLAGSRRRGGGPRRRLAHRPGPPPGARVSHRGEHHLPAHALLRLPPRRVARALRRAERGGGRPLPRPPGAPHRAGRDPGAGRIDVGHGAVHAGEPDLHPGRAGAALRPADAPDPPSGHPPALRRPDHG